MSTEQQRITELLAELDATKTKLKNAESRATYYALELHYYTYVITEADRLFGEKQGTLHNLLQKSFKHLNRSARLFAQEQVWPAYTPKDKQQKVSLRFDAAEKMRNDFSKKVPPGDLFTDYLMLLSPPPEIVEDDDGGMFLEEKKGLSREDAITTLANRYGFATNEACYQFIKRYLEKRPDQNVKINGLSLLPPTWPKV